MGLKNWTYNQKGLAELEETWGPKDFQDYWDASIAPKKKKKNKGQKRKVWWAERMAGNHAQGPVVWEVEEEEEGNEPPSTPTGLQPGSPAPAPDTPVPPESPRPEPETPPDLLGQAETSSESAEEEVSSIPPTQQMHTQDASACVSHFYRC